MAQALVKPWMLESQFGPREVVIDSPPLKPVAYDEAREHNLAQFGYNGPLLFWNFSEAVVLDQRDGAHDQSHKLVDRVFIEDKGVRITRTYEGNRSVFKPRFDLPIAAEDLGGRRVHWEAEVADSNLYTAEGPVDVSKDLKSYKVRIPQPFARRLADGWQYFKERKK